MAFVGDLVVRISANTKALQAGIASGSIALAKMTEVARETVATAADIDDLRVGHNFQQSVTSSAVALDHLEASLSLTAAAANILGLGMSFVTSGMGPFATALSGVVNVASTAMVGLMALRRLIGTLTFMFRLAADGVSVLLMPFRALYSVLAFVAKTVLAVVRPFLSMAATLAKVYITVKAFQLQMKMLASLMSFLPTPLRAVLVGLMGLGAASRVAKAALSSLGVVGRLVARSLSAVGLAAKMIINPLFTARMTIKGFNLSLGATVSAAKSAASAIGSQLARAASSVTTLLGIGVPLAIGGAVKLAASAETLAMQFKVLTGDADSANKVLVQLNDFAANTPFEKMEIGDATRKLLAFGSSADNVFNELKVIGDIAAATGNPIGELAELYGKAQVQGRLFGEDINQLTGRGIPVIQEFAKQFGVGEDQVKKLVEQGKIGFPELQQALQSMTAPGAKFGGMMEQLSGTTAGKFSTFTDNLKMFGAELGSHILPYANELLTWATNVVGSIDGVGTAFGSALATARNWFLNTQAFFIDIGTVVGVVIGDMHLVWQGLFEDIPKYATAALAWLTENFQALIQNVENMVENMFGKLNRTGKQLGEWLAYKTGLSDEMIDIAEVSKKPMVKLTEFKAPDLSAATKTVLQDVNDALALNAAQRASEAAQEVVKQTTAIAQAGTTSQKKVTDTAKETKFAGALSKGSQDAYSVLVQAMTRQKDPATKATEKQTQVIVSKLIPAVRESGAKVSVVDNLLGVV